MIIPPIFELGSVSVVDSSVKNQERIIFRPTEPINLSQIGIMIGWKNENGIIIPLNNSFFWFGEIEISPPCWIVIYTGKGTFQMLKHEQTGHPIYVFYWGRDVTIFNLREIVPVVFKMGGVQIGGHLQPPQTWEQFQLTHNQPPQLQ
jgi:hypothetical protein